MVTLSMNIWKSMAKSSNVAVFLHHVLTSNSSILELWQCFARVGLRGQVNDDNDPSCYTFKINFADRHFTHYDIFWLLDCYWSCEMIAPCFQNQLVRLRKRSNKFVSNAGKVKWKTSKLWHLVTGETRTLASIAEVATNPRPAPTSDFYHEVLSRCWDTQGKQTSSGPILLQKPEWQKIKLWVYYSCLSKLPLCLKDVPIKEGSSLMKLLL